MRVNTQLNWVLPKQATQNKVVWALLVIVALLIGGYWAANSGQKSWFMFILVSGAAVSGLFYALVGIIGAVRHPSRRIYGVYTSAGCGGCRGVAWESSGSYHADNFTDCGGFDSGGGCGDGGCGGGGGGGS